MHIYINALHLVNINLNVIIGEGGVDFEELEKALTIIKKKG
jgi:hypothetical protein